jgi:hypothetical protein
MVTLFIIEETLIQDFVDGTLPVKEEVKREVKENPGFPSHSEAVPLGEESAYTELS